MSYASEYQKLRKKRLEEQAKKSNPKSHAQNYAELRRKKLLGEDAENDIGPVGAVDTFKAAFSEQAKRQTQQEQERTWFTAGEFDDGWQAWDLTKTILGTGADLIANVGGGLLEMGENAVDAGAYLIGGAGELFGAKDFSEGVKNFIASDLYSGEEIASRIISLGAVGEGGFDDSSILGEKLDSIAQSGGQLAGQIGLQFAGVPWWVTSGVTSFGKEVESAFNEGADYGQAGLSGLISAGSEILTEKLFGGSGLGEKGLINLEGLTKRLAGKTIAKASADFLLDVAAEGAEEVISSILSRLGTALYKEENLSELLLSEEAVDEYIESFIGGAALGGIMNASKVDQARAKKGGRDYRTGLTKNEQKVFDEVYKEAIADQKKSGKELSEKEEAKIYDDVMERLQKGDISTDTIERLLGGETYKAYQAEIEKDNAAIEKLKTLYKNEELEQKIKGIVDNSKSAELKKQLSKEVEKIALNEGDLMGKSWTNKRNSYLLESYNELAKRGQVFKADINQYDEKYRSTVQKAIDSGILNNTRKTHEMVDMIAKISAKKGIEFDFANNEKLKETGFALEGKTVNGYVTKDGNIVLNLNSANYLNSVVGHELTHVLEGSDLYDALQKEIVEYAKSKGEYDDRLRRAIDLYSNVDGYKGADGQAAIEKEVVADLVGDYIFTDAEFVRNLHNNNRNVFQKIWDEIKYLYKVATAGSKEARQLEKVKHLFEKVYQEGGKATGEVKYSIERTKSMSWGDQINGALYNGNNIRRNDTLVVGSTAESVKSDGISDKPLAVPLRVISKATSGKDVSHSINRGKIAKLDVGIREAPIVAVNPERNALIYITNVKQGGLPIVATFDMDATFDGDVVHQATSIHLQTDTMSLLQSLPKSATVYVQKKGELETVGATNNLRGLAANIKLAERIIPQKEASVKRFSLSSMGTTFFGDENASPYKFEEGAYKQTPGYLNYVNECLNNYKQTRGADYDEAVARKEIEDSIDGIVRVAIAAKKAGYDIFDDGVKRSKTDSKNRLLFSSLEPNSDYFTSSDISTICDKRQNFAEIYDDIVKAEEAKGVPQGKRFFDNIDNYFYLHGILAEKGLTQPCRQCYVESMRKNLAPMASAFLRLVNETDANNIKNDQLYQQKGKNKGTLKTNNAALRERVLDILAENDMSASDLTVEMLTTEDGLAQLKITAPLVYEAFNSFYGQSKPKMPKSATPFRFGELTALLTDEKGRIKQSLVDKINATGGFRLQSYSDFQIKNYTDVLQVIFEAGTLGLKGHAYTKVPAFLEATNGTNLKRNISIFMYKDGNEWKLDRNDSFPYTLEEIYNIVKADKSGNTGIIAVSQNEDMSAWIMANDLVAYGIPFHKSGLKMGTVRDTIVKEYGREIKGYTGTKDHTRQQTEVWATTTADHKALTKVKNGINIYEFWDFDNKKGLSKNKLIEKNVKRYIDECVKAGYKPKFREYVENNGKVLNSTLEYAKELGFVSQDATIEDISFKYKGYTIPYGYYKFLGDFGMFTPDGKASPHKTLSLNDYDFDKAVKFFEDSETLRRNEILQQFANDGERQKYAESNLTAGELLEVIKQKRVSVVDDVLSRYGAPVRNSLSEEGVAPDPATAYNSFNIRGEDVLLDAPIREDIAKAETTEDIDPIRDDIANVVEEENEKKARLSRSIKRIYRNFEQDKADLQEEINLRRDKIPINDDSGHYALDQEYQSRLKELELQAETKVKNAKTAEQRKVKHENLQAKIERIAGDISTWVDKKFGFSYKTNTLRRNLRDIVRDENGNRDIAKADEIYELLQGNYNKHEAELNKEANRIKKVYADMKITDAESTYIQMLGEFRHNPDTQLKKEDVDKFLLKNKSKIDEAKVDKAIELARETYDSLLVRVNEALREAGMKEIPYRKGYFPHFTENKQGRLAKLFNWKTQNNDIPTDIAGITEQFNPNRTWQPFNKQRKSDTTDYNFLKGMDNYVFGALDWIYHIEDIQTRREFENYIRYSHSEEGVREKIAAIRANDELDADEMQDQIDLVYATAANPLNNFVTDLRAGTNKLANKKSSLDRGMEEMVNRKVYSTLTNISNRVSANMVGGSISSALTNFIPITQSWGQVSPISSLKAMVDTIRSKFRDDGTVQKSTFLTNRLETVENLYQTKWDKFSDKIGALMEGIDSFTSQTVWRSKYLENISKGMSEADAIANADQFAENVMAGRSRGNMPTIFDSKNPLIKTLTAFQLEVANQYGYMLKDMPQDVKEKTKGNLVKGYAAMFFGAYAYNALFSALTGRDSAFDPIGIIEDLLKDLGLFGEDDQEEPVDVALNLAENIAQEIPFVGGLIGGGRVPISSALPYDGNLFEMIEATGKAIESKDFTALTKEWLKPLYYVAMPVGGGQLKKTVEGLSMFSDDLPIAGSYTNSGDLRFPVEDNFGNRLQAALFGQWSSQNAREYFDKGWSPLNEKQQQEFKDSGMTIQEYHDYREGLKDLSTQADKVDYINGLDLTDTQKNVLLNNVLDRDTKVDVSELSQYGDLEEFDFAQENPQKYKWLNDNGYSYSEYKNADEDGKRALTWASENPAKYEVAKVVVDNIFEYRKITGDLYNLKADKDANGNTISGSKKKKVLNYINNLDLDYGAKLILYKSEYKSDDTYNSDIVEYLNSRDDLSFSQIKTILEELNFGVDSKGNISW